MNKVLKIVLAAILCLGIVLALCAPVFAAERTWNIRNVTDLLKLAESCRLDTYSDGLTVELVADIDLTGTEFDGIPTFGGVFHGNGHTIYGVDITATGSEQGFFRYVRAGAVVSNLNIKGKIAPEGSRSTVGGIAGSNAGTLENCSFEGEIAGADRIGGIAGENKLTGIITGCQVHGAVIGNHFVGGVAGINYGVIRNCKNNAEINTTAAQNKVELSDITIETITDSEAANTVTDVGGIAGSSTGVVRGCANYGDVGYQLMGYNIGGIAGAQSGYMTECTNYGSVFGRKEVGGIVGHMEPVTNIQYSEDTLQILEGQVGTLGVLANNAAANARYGASEITGQIAVLEGQAQTAQEALDILMPDAENPEMPDEDTILAAQNNLTESITEMPATLDKIATAAENVTYSISRDLQAVSNQVNVVGATINSASENLGITITDISDSDSDEELLGKVEKCENHGNVLGDANVGGIAGAVAYENDFDPEEDIDIFGDASLNFAGEIRAVVKNCSSTGEITVKKQNGGGIVGWQSLGLVKGCLNTGAVAGDTADYVGGVVGASDGFLRESSAKCFITGSAYTGGIAGTGNIVSDCRSMVKLSANEKFGAILGTATEMPDRAAEEQKIFGNYYLIVERDIGAVDGVSYESCAQSMKQDKFFALGGLDSVFRTVTVRFVFEDGSSQMVRLTPGMPLNPQKVPEVPEKEGYAGRWVGLEEIDVASIQFDVTVHTEYTRKISVIESEEKIEGQPAVLAQGEFNEKHGFVLSEMRFELSLEGREKYLAGYGFAITGGTAQKLRCFIGEGYDAEKLRVVLCDADGNARTESVYVEGSYAVFEVKNGDEAFAVVKAAENYTLEIALGAVAAVVIVFIVIMAVRGRKKKAALANTEE